MQQLQPPKIIEITVNSEMLNKYASYKIQIDQVVIARRFNDFVQFYEALKINYPGLFIPRLPMKQVVGNMTEEFLRVRRRMLQHFMNSLFKRKILWNSPESQSFFNEQHHQWVAPANNAQSLQDKYSADFGEQTNLEITIDMKCQYYDFQSFIVKIKPMIENFKRMCSNYVTAKANFNTEKLIFVNYVLPDFEKTLLFKSDKRFFEKVKPLDLFKSQKYDQVRKSQNDQILLDLQILESDIESYVLQFEQIRKWEDKINRLEDKIRQAQLDLQQTINNQRNPVSKLLFGSKEKEILRLQSIIDQCQNDIQNIRCLINLTMGQVCLFEIPEFTSEKETNFFKLVKTIGTMELEQLSAISEYWQSILDSRLISQISQQQTMDSILITEQQVTQQEGQAYQVEQKSEIVESKEQQQFQEQN